MTYFEESVEIVSIVGAVEITAENSSRFVVLNSDGEFELAGAGDNAYGVITTNQPADAAGRVAFAGTVPVEAGETIAVGDLIAAGADGVAVVAGTGDPVLGIARTAGGAGDPITGSAGDPIAVHLNRPLGAPAA